MKDRHDPPLGLRDGLRYREYELTLSPGDVLFQYTDGVTEATDIALTLFGEERLTRSLNRRKDLPPAELVAGVHGSIDEFVKEAPQFDDITMLCVKYMGPKAKDENENTAALEVPARIDQLDEVIGFIEQQLERAGCSSDNMFAITLSAEVKYKYLGGKNNLTIKKHI